MLSKFWMRGLRSGRVVDPVRVAPRALQPGEERAGQTHGRRQSTGRVEVAHGCHLHPAWGSRECWTDIKRRGVWSWICH